MRKELNEQKEKTREKHKWVEHSREGRQLGKTLNRTVGEQKAHHIPDSKPCHIRKVPNKYSKCWTV